MNTQRTVAYSTPPKTTPSTFHLKLQKGHIILTVSPHPGWQLHWHNPPKRLQTPTGHKHTDFAKSELEALFAFQASVIQHLFSHTLSHFLLRHTQLHAGHIQYKGTVHFQCHIFGTPTTFQSVNDSAQCSHGNVTIWRWDPNLWPPLRETEA